MGIVVGKVHGQNFGYGTTGQQINLLRIEENLSAAHLRLAGVTVENLPWLECAERYDREHTFLYLDPPYWRVEGYGVPFEFAEYERMAAFLRRCKARAMISINDHAEIRRAFDGLHINQLGIRYSLAKCDKRGSQSGELVITNYEPGLLGGLL